MNKKSLIILIVAVILIVAGFAIFGGSSDEMINNDNNSSVNTENNSTTTPSEFTTVNSDSTDSSLLAKVKRASVSVTEDGSRTALSNGTANFSVAGSNVAGNVKSGDIAIEKTKGSRKDVLSTISVNTGGSVTNYYVVILEENSGDLRDRSLALIGDRVTITGIRADDVSDNNVDYIVTVTYKDRDGANRTKILVVENGYFNSSKEISL